MRAAEALLAIVALAAAAVLACCWRTAPQRLQITFYGNYCGPGDGDGFEAMTVDGIDALCKQHDWCIGEALRSKMPIPLRSHTNPAYGCEIQECDMQFLESARAYDSSSCGADSAQFYFGSLWKVRCLAFLKLSMLYHEMKVAETCSAIAAAPEQWACSERQAARRYCVAGGRG